MYEDKKRVRINWVRLLVKLIILIIIFLLILFIIKWVKNKRAFVRQISDSEYTTDVGIMKDAAFEYFTYDRLPTKIGGTKKLTLREMIDQKLIVDFTEDGHLCLIDDSYIQATKTSDENYALKVQLNCNSKSDYIVTTIENKENICKASNSCSSKENGETTKEESNKIDSESNNSNSKSSSSSSSSKSSSSSSKSSSSYSKSSSSSSSSKTSSSTSSTSSTTTPSVTNIINNTIITSSCNNCCPSCEPPKPSPQKVIYYKHVKYSNWTTDVLTGTNVETKTVKKAYETTCTTEKNKNVYVAAVMSHHTIYGTIHSIEVNMSKFIEKNGYNYKIKSVNYFSDADYTNYYNQSYKPVFIIGDTIPGNVCLDAISNMKGASLRKANFTYKTGNLYNKNGSNFLPIQLTYNNAVSVDPICNCATGEKIFFLPLKINVSYSLDKTCTKSQEITYYRTYSYIWTTNIHEEGYTYTGIFEERYI